MIAKTKFTRVHARRLLKLADFLENEVPEKVWDFSKIMRLGEKPPKEAFESGGGCGTVGCALGWAPAAFPRHWMWTKKHGFPKLHGRRIDTFASARRFFGLEAPEDEFLFAPGAHLYNDGGGFVSNGLSMSSSPEQVAANIRRFVAMKKNGDL